jgi:hypothetical protein
MILRRQLLENKSVEAFDGGLDRRQVDSLTDSQKGFPVVFLPDRTDKPQGSQDDFSDNLPGFRKHVVLGEEFSDFSLDELAALLRKTLLLFFDETITDPVATLPEPGSPCLCFMLLLLKELSHEPLGLSLKEVSPGAFPRGRLQALAQSVI